MMNLLWIIGGGGLLGGTALYLLTRPRKEIEQSELQHCIQGFVMTKQDGARLILSPAKTDLAVALLRRREQRDSCEVLVQVKQPEWTEWHDSLHAELDRQMFEPRIVSRDGANVLELDVAVSDVFAREAGAQVARALMLMFQLVGVGRDERLEIALHGENSARLWKSSAERQVTSRNPLVRWIGRSTLRGLKEEEEKSQKGDGPE